MDYFLVQQFLNPVYLFIFFLNPVLCLAQAHVPVPELQHRGAERERALQRVRGGRARGPEPLALPGREMGHVRQSGQQHAR